VFKYSCRQHAYRDQRLAGYCRICDSTRNTLGTEAFQLNVNDALALARQCHDCCSDMFMRDGEDISSSGNADAGIAALTPT